MLINHQREKLLNAAVYFARYTEKCGITKLFKLLYFLDFEHYKQTGRSVTGLEYSAWKMGPVPEELYEEIPAPEPDFAKRLRLQPIPTRYDNPLIQIVAIDEFDPSNFSRREFDLLGRRMSGKIDHIGTLPHDVTVELLACAIESFDITSKQRDILQEVLNKLPADEPERA